MKKRKGKTRFERFDASDYLDDTGVLVEYLSAALEDQDPDVFLRAVENVAKARGIGEVARATGLGRESLYKSLAPGAKPRYDTIVKVVNSLGVRLVVVPTPG